MKYRNLRHNEIIRKGDQWRNKYVGNNYRWYRVNDEPRYSETQKLYVYLTAEDDEWRRPIKRKSK